MGFTNFTAEAAMERRRGCTIRPIAEASPILDR
jgi:hypothetical protein